MKITTHLWFDKEAKEAAEFYTTTFKNSKILSKSELHDTPSGDVDVLNIKVEDHEFTLISAGPVFKFTPAISFMVACDSKEEVDELWSKLSQGGTAMMELGSYPFSERYGWIADKYGLSWQLMYMEKEKINQKITPTLMFVGKVCGKAEEAIEFYTSVFKNSTIDAIMRYSGEEGSGDKPGTVMHANFTLEGQKFNAMDSAYDHKFNFNEAISFMVSCKDQDEIDYYWERLSAVPESEQCGWLKDKYGVSWQIVPAEMDKMMQSRDKAKVARVTEAFLKMKKFDLAALKRAEAGK
jgi:predicted 3-demethylubiquinone-9 3-methyltransferase (glyoxalase superfamily)